MDSRTSKLADILVNYSIGVKSGDWVIIRGDMAGLPLVNEVLRYTLQAGGNPTVLMDGDIFKETFLREASDETLKWVSPVEKMLHEEADAMIFVRGADNTRSLNGIEPHKQTLKQNTDTPFRQMRLDRAAAGSLRWVLTMYPCAAYAQEADMSLREYQDFVYRATFADQDDPIGKWCEIHDMQQTLVDWLKGKDKVVVRGPNVHLNLSIKERTFINSDGLRNMPSGEIFTGPVENSVNGWVRYTYPAIREGREVDGIELKFEDGKVVGATADKNQGYLLSQLDSDPGARYLGEFAIGTNTGIQQFTKSILFDEKIAGTIHMAVGMGYPETGSKNRSSVHWDMICDMRTDSTITVDGELFYKNGEFQI